MAKLSRQIKWIESTTKNLIHIKWHSSFDSLGIQLSAIGFTVSRHVIFQSDNLACLHCSDTDCTRWLVYEVHYRRTRFTSTRLFPWQVAKRPSQSQTSCEKKTRQVRFLSANFSKHLLLIKETQVILFLSLQSFFSSIVSKYKNLFIKR